MQREKKITKESDRLSEVFVLRVMWLQREEVRVSHGERVDEKAKECKC